MQKNNSQHEQFLREFGALLTGHTRHGHAVQQQQALLYLAEHVSSARRYHRLSRATLAQKTGKAEAEIYALEQGLLPYSALDVRFLYKLATALDDDLETLLLLLGRPALVQSLHRQGIGHDLQRRTALHNQPHRLRNTSVPGESTTGSQPGDNLLTFTWWANLLHKGCLNLIDSMQEGRLFGYVRHSQRAWVPLTMFVCLLCIWVGTYSFLGHFDAQSTAPSYTIVSAPTTVPHRSGAQSKLAIDIATPVTLAITTPNRPSPVRATAHAVEDNLVTPLLLSMPLLSADAQLCDFRTVGKFALCRV